MPNTQEVYDAYGRLIIRVLASTGSSTNVPVNEPISSFGQWGMRVEEEDRVTTVAVLVLDPGTGERSDPATGLRDLQSPTSLTGSALDDLQSALDILGFVPVFGEVADHASGGISLAAALTRSPADGRPGGLPDAPRGMPHDDSGSP